MAFNRKYMEVIHEECIALGERKSNDYSSVADGIEICGLKGISVRLVDKVLRIASLTNPGTNQLVKDESIRDTLLDVINYATYGICLLDGQWGLDGVQIRRDNKENPNEHVTDALAYLTGPTQIEKEVQIRYNRVMTEAVNKLALDTDKLMMKEQKKGKRKTAPLFVSTIKIRRPKGWKLKKQVWTQTLKKLKAKKK